MPLISIIANWLKGWGIGVPVDPYAEWLTPITVSLMPNVFDTYLMENTSTLSLCPNPELIVSLVQGDELLVKMESNIATVTVK